MSNNGKLLIISGPSAAGVTTIAYHIVANNNDYETVRTVTTRTPRDAEILSYGYVFWNREEFETAIEQGKFIEYSKFLDNYYGVLRQFVDEKLNQGTNVLMEAPIDNAEEIRKQYPDAVFAFIIPPSALTLVKRLNLRNYKEEKMVSERLTVYEQEIYTALKADILLVNDVVENTVSDLIKSMNDPIYRRKIYEDNVERVVGLKKELKRYSSLKSLYVFISYSTQNQAEADALKKFLDENGISTWMAPYDIPAGSKYAENINQAIKNCTCCVLLLSNAAQNSVWVAKEIERVINYRKTLIPVSIEDVILNDEFELYISSNQILTVKDFTLKSEELKRALGVIKSSLEKAQRASITIL